MLFDSRSKAVLIPTLFALALLFFFLAKLRLSNLTSDSWLAAGVAVVAVAIFLVVLVFISKTLTRNSAEAGQRKAEARARSLLDRVPAIVYQVQFGSTVTWKYVSARIQSILGFTPEEWMTDSHLWFKQVHPEDREEVLAKGMSSSLSGKPFTCEYRMFTRDGRLVWFRDEGSVVKDRERKSAIIQGVMLDITEKKRSEILQTALYRLAERTNSAQTLEQYCRSVHESVSELMDTRNFYIALYDSATRKFSFPFSVSERKFTMARQNASKGLPGYVLNNGPLLADSAKIEELTRSGEIVDDGVPFVQWLGVPLRSNEKLLGMLSVQSFSEDLKFVHEDLSSLLLVAAEVATTLEQKRVEKILQDKAAQLSAVTEAMTVFLEGNNWKAACRLILRTALRETGSEYGFIGVAEGDLLRIILQEGVVWNHQSNPDFFEDPLQVSEDNSHPGYVNLNRLFQTVLSGGAAVVTNDPETESLSGQFLTSGQIPMRSFLGVPLHAENRAKGVIGLLNSPKGYTNSDVEKLEFLSRTIQVLYNSFLQTQKQEALQEELRQSQKMDAVKQFAGGVAHDFNNLLIEITGYCELLLSKLGNSPLSREVKEILKASGQGAALTRQLLAFGTKPVVAPRLINLNYVLRDVEDLLTRLVGVDIEVEMIYCPDLGQVHADPGQMEQVILNLALNARDAMPNGGKLYLETFEVEVSDQESEEPFGIPPGSYAGLRVKDTGEGMDESTLNRIFEPFFTSKKAGVGSGLGLATVYGIVKQSNGHVNVQSELGSGTTFEIFLEKIDPPSGSELS